MKNGIAQLKGVILEWVHNNNNEEIIFQEVLGGRRWRMWYEPDCCACCDIEDIVGDLQDLVGHVIIEAEEETNETDAPPDNGYSPESYTWTYYKIGTHKGRVTIRWYGSSNGYYSETASFREIDPYQS